MIQIIDKFEDIDREQWVALLADSAQRGFFQSPEAYQLYGMIETCKPFAVAVVRDSALKGVCVGHIQAEGGKVKRYLSRRAIVNAGPLLADDVTADEVAALMKAVADKLKGKAIYAETRNFFNYDTLKDVFADAQFKYEPHLNFQIDTTSEEVVQQNMGKSRKRDIKVTLRDGAEIVANPTDDEVRQYYTILAELYRTKVKTPLLPERFFVNLNRQPYGHLLLVRYEGNIIGGTVCVGKPGEPLYEWFACGEDGKFKNIHASTLATYAGIQYAAQHGHPVFDMMGAGKPGEGYGVRDFKAKFGGKLVEDGRYIRVLNRPLYELGKLGVKMIKKGNLNFFKSQNTPPQL